MEYTWNAFRSPLVFNRPKSWMVVGFGVAVNANIETLGCLPLLWISDAIISSASSRASSPDPRAIVTADISFPAVEECASSMITAKVFSFKFFTQSAMYKNFWIVVAMIFVLLFSAIARSAELHFSSITFIRPDLCSIRMIAFCSCWSTTSRSVTIMMLSKMILLSASCRELRR